MKPDDTIIDLEAYAAENRPVPGGHQYRIRVDASPFTVHSPITGTAVLALVGKSPAEWDLLLKLRPHGQRVVTPAESVDLTTPGVERFVTMKRQVTDGDAQPGRREASIRGSDIGFLDSLGTPWEAIKDGKTTLVLIAGVQLPPGLDAGTAAPDGKVSVCFRLDAAYPDTQIDMAYFHPHLRRKDGRGIPNVSDVVIDGRTWQQWSRHRGDGAAWRPNIDGIDTHFAFMQSWLLREVSR